MLAFEKVCARFIVGDSARMDSITGVVVPVFRLALHLCGDTAHKLIRAVGALPPPFAFGRMQSTFVASFDFA
jgi:hypothetical protein